MNYKDFDEKDYLKIREIISDDERVLYKERINEDYSHDELGDIKCYPDIVVQVLSTDEVSGVMRYAYENSIPVTPRGSGTGLVGAAVPKLRVL